MRLESDLIQKGHKLFPHFKNNTTVLVNYILTEYLKQFKNEINSNCNNTQSETSTE